ncbi:hypothetical protein [Geomicrobium sp. JCM 19055]|uniref:hypothetical protein n=1 Tax=Geomicrobium sp. JCM 19055 TaxID=1460649 RepID=UPI0005AA5A65|nr:hypothetical protein [Geomicrobium sp. JCM 19055]
MKRKEWVIFILLLLLGIHFLAMSMWMFQGEQVHSTYFDYFMSVCLWICLPMLILFTIYAIGIVIYTVIKRSRIRSRG